MKTNKLNRWILKKGSVLRIGGFPFTIRKDTEVFGNTAPGESHDYIIEKA